MPFPLRRVVGSLSLALAVGGILPPGAGGALGALSVSGDEPTVEAFASSDFVVEVFPNQSPEASFSDSWGARRRGGRRHRGTDIHSPKGTPVVAVAEGRVTAMEWNRLSGWVIRIDHGGGWVTAYAHLNNDTLGTDDGDGGPEHAFAPGLAVGSFVIGGELIGFVGDSGNAEGTVPHTHFEIRQGEEKVNPFPYLEAAWLRETRLRELL